jgi:hypothetical protein
VLIARRLWRASCALGLARHVDNARDAALAALNVFLPDSVGRDHHGGLRWLIGGIRDRAAWAVRVLRPSCSADLARGHSAALAPCATDQGARPRPGRRSAGSLDALVGWRICAAPPALGFWALTVSLAGCRASSSIRTT